MAYEACTRVYTPTEISIRAEPGISNVYDAKIFIRVSMRACDRKKGDASFSNPLVWRDIARVLCERVEQRWGRVEAEEGEGKKEEI